MDFPIFHLDYLGNRHLIAIIATLHVLINHALAVGAAPLITLLEWKGLRSGDQRWDHLAYKILFVCFIVTTSVGALTGVGIWFSTSLVNPQAIGSLIRVFFWAWFTEWIVFVSEVVLIVAYFLSWRGWGQRHKRLHILLGGLLSLFSWLTMAIIVAVLSFQMDTGAWAVNPSLLNAALNPLYLPQLLFRTPFAMVSAGLFSLMLIFFFVKQDREFRARAVRFTSAWIMGWSGLWLLGAFTYWRAIPEAMSHNIDVALATIPLENWSTTLSLLIIASVLALLALSYWGLILPRRLPGVALLIPCFLSFWLLSYFERIREFVRKPDVIASYMYSNGLRHADYPLYREEGLLTHATYSPVRFVTQDNELSAGREMFRIACTRCHTTSGVNSVVAKLGGLYGWQSWDPVVIQNYLASMHNTRPFMPPAPGTDEELAALSAYLIALRDWPSPLRGAQSHGVVLAYP